MEMLVYVFYGNLEYFRVIWCILWPFGNVVVIWYISLVLVYCVKKSGNPGPYCHTVQTVYVINNKLIFEYFASCTHLYAVFQ
jgi:hypothetical protein